MISSTVMPYLRVSDGKAAIRFYEQAFGAEPLNVEMTESATADFPNSQLAICGGVVMLGTDEAADDRSERGAHGRTSAMVRLGFDTRQDFKAAMIRCIVAGAETIMHAQRTKSGEIQAIVRDPDGHIWTLVAPE